VLPALAAMAAGVAAGDPSVLWHAQIDNDVAFHTDRWYTSGVRIYRSVPLEEAAPVAAVLRLSSARTQRLDVGIIHDVYTADGRADPSLPDRPNAGRLLLSLARHDVSPETLATLGIDAGVSGPAARGEEAQKLIHRIAPAPPTDWSRQVDNRADVQLVGAWSHRLGLDAIPGALVVHGGAVAGTITTFAHAGIEWRTDGPAEAANPLLRFAATPPLPGNARGLSLYAGASLRAIARNRLFERREDDPKPQASYERRVSRVAAGIGWSDAWGVITLGLAQDAREFEGQHSPHRFGSLTFSIPFD
jgi:lipid A 3-O-deacylase